MEEEEAMPEEAEAVMEAMEEGEAITTNKDLSPPRPRDYAKS